MIRRRSFLTAAGAAALPATARAADKATLRMDWALSGYQGRFIGPGRKAITRKKGSTWTSPTARVRRNRRSSYRRSRTRSVWPMP